MLTVSSDNDTTHIKYTVCVCGVGGARYRVLGC